MAGEVRGDGWSETPRISTLPYETATNIVATSIIPDLKAVIVSLLKNSLDAKADNVTITIDHSRGYCKISDNGRGISQEDFKSTGRLGQLNSTSEHPQQLGEHPTTRSGRFLSCLARISLLEITSKTLRDQGWSQLVFHQGVIIERLINGDEDQYDGFTFGSAGTVVVVKDVFGNLPVRVKQRAMGGESGSSDDRNWQAIVQIVVSILLAWPAACRVALKENTGKLRNVTLFAEHPRTSRSLTRSALCGDRSVKASLACKMIQKLAIPYQAKLCPTRHTADWVPVLATMSRVEIKGFICLRPSPHTTCQFISQHARPVDKSETEVNYYDAVNKIFARSSFGAGGQDLAEHGKGTVLRTDESIRKDVDRHPMYMFAIAFRKSKTVPSKGIPSTETIQSLLISAVEQWLVVNKYFLGRVKNSVCDSMSQPTVDASQTKISAGIGQPMPMSEMAKPARKTKAQPHAADVQSWTRIRSSRPIIMEDVQLRPKADISDSIAKHQAIMSSVLDKRQNAQRVEYLSEDDHHHNGNPESLTPAGSMFIEDGPSLPARITDWQAGLFEASESDRVPLCVPVLEDLETSKFRHALDVRKFSQLQRTTTHSLSKEDLKQATVIKQVDLKFILCQVQRPESGGSLIFVIDQHAASERVLLERLLQDFTKPIEIATSQSSPALVETVTLEKRIIFETTNQEHDAFIRRTDDFAAWGIIYNTSVLGEPCIPSHQPKEYRIAVRALPPVIAERCRLAPRILIDLLRSEVWEMAVPLSHAALHVLKANAVTGQPGWLTRLNRCPKRVLDLINSRACRSAVMFNDLLSKEECTKLVRELSETVFPMMCAHGRTSVVPLFETGKMTSINLTGDDDYTAAYQRWKH